jgi:hypothetical protein
MPQRKGSPTGTWGRDIIKPMASPANLTIRQGICRLCGKQADLRESHIYPAFAVRWLKESSATGYLRSTGSDKRMQDTDRVKLLCADCEQILSKDEKQFAEKLFVPLQEGRKQSFDYEEWLIRFLVGFHFRILVTREGVGPQHAEEHYARVEEDWKQFLLGKKSDWGQSEFHVFFSDVIQDASQPVSPKTNWYLATALDSRPTFSDSGHAGCYGKLLRVMSFSFMSSRDPLKEQWDGTQVFARGKLVGPRQSIKSSGFWPLIQASIKAVEEKEITMTDRQTNALLDAIQKDPQRFLNSESMRVREATVALSHRMAAKEFSKVRVKGRNRNSPCPCGSGEKYKRCHGR